MPPKPDNTSMASNTPRRSHQSPHSLHIHGILYLIDGHFWLKSSLYYLLHNIQQHVILNTYYLILIFYCFFDWNLWPFPARIANSFMNIYDFIDDHSWPKKSAKRKTIYEHLWLHWLKFMTISSAKRKFIYEHLWLHWWSFLTKKSAKRKTEEHLYFIDIILD